MPRRSALAWGLELGTQFLFYMSPDFVSYPKMMHYLTKTLFGGDYRAFATWSSIFVANITWIIPSLFYLALYYFQFPFFEKYRSQDWVWNQEPSIRRTQYMAVVKSTIVNMIASQFVISIGFYVCARITLSHVSEDYHEIIEWFDEAPSAWENFWRLMAALAIFETAFYWLHRWMHTKQGYPYHKDHHAYYTPISIAGQWGSFVDGLLSLPIPSFFPVILFRFHILTCWFYITIHVFHSQYDHAGYNFPYNPLQLIPFGSHCDAHNFHHSHSIDNFGLYWRIWDIVMGTNQSWENFRRKRDIALARQKELAQNSNGGSTDHNSTESNATHITEFNDDDFHIDNGVVVLNTVAQDRDIRDGTDNLMFTLEQQKIKYEYNGMNETQLNKSTIDKDINTAIVSTIEDDNKIAPKKTSTTSSDNDDDNLPIARRTRRNSVKPVVAA